jgi:hypothetical protein
MKTQEKTIRDKVYLINSEKTPVTFFIQSRSNKKKQLLHFDEEKNINRPLRYSRNQRSVFEDEQDGTAILEPIVMEDGKLTVLKTNPLLQKFMDIHPDNLSNGGNLFYEFDPQKVAEDKVKDLNLEVDALIAARSLDLEVMKAIARVHLGVDVDRMTSSEIKHDILLFAKNYPEDFLYSVDDPDISVNDFSSRAFREGYITFRAGKDIHYNLSNNKKKILTVPFGERKEDVFMTWLKSNEGVEFYKYLEKEFSEN